MGRVQSGRYPPPVSTPTFGGDLCLLDMAVSPTPHKIRFVHTDRRNDTRHQPWLKPIPCHPLLHRRGRSPTMSIFLRAYSVRSSADRTGKARFSRPRAPEYSPSIFAEAK